MPPVFTSDWFSKEIAEMIRTELLKISKVCFEDIP